MTARIYNRVLQTAIEAHGEEHQIHVAIEEMAELTKAIVKLWRAGSSGGNEDLETLEKNIVEEIADVRIMVDQLAMIFGPQRVDCVESNKLRRLAHMLEMRLDQVDS